MTITCQEYYKIKNIGQNISYFNSWVHYSVHLSIANNTQWLRCLSTRFSSVMVFLNEFFEKVLSLKFSRHKKKYAAKLDLLIFQIFEADLFSFVVSHCEFVTFPLVSLVTCGNWLYRFLIFAPLLTLFLTNDIYSKCSKYFQHFSLSFLKENFAYQDWNSQNVVNMANRVKPRSDCFFFRSSLIWVCPVCLQAGN